MERRLPQVVNVANDPKYSLLQITIYLFANFANFGQIFGLFGEKFKMVKVKVYLAKIFQFAKFCPVKFLLYKISMKKVLYTQRQLNMFSFSAKIIPLFPIYKISKQNSKLFSFVKSLISLAIFVRDFFLAKVFDEINTSESAIPHL